VNSAETFLAPYFFVMFVLAILRRIPAGARYVSDVLAARNANHAYLAGGDGPNVRPALGSPMPRRYCSRHGEAADQGRLIAQRRRD
jgi:hypothetical protein